MDVVDTQNMAILVQMYGYLLESNACLFIRNLTVKNCIEVGHLGNLLKICLVQFTILVSIHLVDHLSLDLIRREWLRLW